MPEIKATPAIEIPAIKIDMERLYKVAVEAAHKAAEREIVDFYDGYGSPFRKKVKEALEKTIPDGNFEIPNLLEKTQDALVAEFEKNANKSIVECCANQLQKCLTKLPLEKDGSIKLSKVFDIMSTDAEYGSTMKLEAEKDLQYGWYEVTVTITNNEGRERTHEFVLHSNEYQKEHKDKYTILSLRENDYYDDAKMKIGNLDVRMPVFKNLAHSSVLMTIAKLVMYEIPIEIDDTYFESNEKEDY